MCVFPLVSRLNDNNNSFCDSSKQAIIWPHINNRLNRNKVLVVTVCSTVLQSAKQVRWAERGSCWCHCVLNKEVRCYSCFLFCGRGGEQRHGLGVMCGE